MINNKRFIYIIKTVILTILFISALYFENAQQQRLLVLIAVFLCFMVSNITKYFIDTKNKLYSILFIVDLILIHILEFNSRLLINYFLHSFYIIVLMESSVTLSLKKGIIIGIVTVLVSMIKFIYLAYYKFNFLNISQLVFFLLINVLILTIALFAQHNKKEKEKKDLLYKELVDAHKKLKEYIDEVQRLSVIEERNRIARDIHDNLGHNMTALIMQLQMAEHYLKIDSLKSEELLNNSVKTAKHSLTSIREVVETLRGNNSVLLSDKAIQVLVDEFSENTGTQIDLKVNGKVTKNYNSNTALYHILQEGMTNAVRHGKATNIWIELSYEGDTVKFSIKDNGVGSATINEGFGMKGIRERVQALNGTVEFKSENGFTVIGGIYD